jgi:hypothetical protein
LTPTIRFHEHFRNLVKNCHPRNVRGDTRRPETLERSDRGRFRGTTPPPLVPINRRLPLLKFFTALLLLSRFVTLSLHGISSCASEFATFELSSDSSKVLFFSLFNSYLFFLLHQVLYFAPFIHESCSYFFVPVTLLVRWLESKAPRDP